jgi:hypothetical protein
MYELEKEIKQQLMFSPQSTLRKRFRQYYRVVDEIQCHAFTLDTPA